MTGTDPNIIIKILSNLSKSLIVISLKINILNITAQSEIDVIVNRNNTVIYLVNNMFLLFPSSLNFFIILPI